MGKEVVLYMHAIERWIDPGDVLDPLLGGVVGDGQTQDRDRVRR